MSCRGCFPHHQHRAALVEAARWARFDPAAIDGLAEIVNDAVATAHAVGRGAIRLRKRQDDRAVVL